MIKVTDIGGNEIYVNPDLIEKIELVPDTVLMMMTNRRVVVRNRPEEIIGMIEDYKRRCNDPVRRLRDELREFCQNHRH